MRVNDIPKEAADNPTIFDSYVKAQSVLKKHDAPFCSVSGGSDSDVVLDIMCRLDAEKKIRYIWFNTGLEYKATKNHLNYLEQRYGIKIERMSPVLTVPASVKKFGVPFLNKSVSEMAGRLQKHGFKWEDCSYDELVQKYPNCQAALHWWTNSYTQKCGKGGSMFNIDHNPGLKEFLLEHPPGFPISSKCCDYAKKATAHKAQKGGDLSITGIRKAEGGVRAARFHNCYTAGGDVDEYRPVFWYTDQDKKEYEELFDVVHSDCYRVWGFKRTGCVGCPFNRNFESELAAVKQHEPAMYKACMKVFGPAYEYTAKYREFQEQLRQKRREERKKEADKFGYEQLTMDDAGCKEVLNG